MILTDRFTIHPMQKQTFVQAECPVYIHCSRRCTEKRSGASFVQVRMVNCCDRMVCSVFLRIEGIDEAGKSCYVLNDVVLPECNAMPRAVFGEERILSVERAEVKELQITVERVCFADGMMWRRLPRQKLMDIHEWNRCACGMRNPQNASACVLCGRSLLPKKEKVVVQIPPQEQVEPMEQFEQMGQPERISIMPIFEKPAPIVRPSMPIIVPPVKEQKYSRKLKAALFVLLFLALAVLAGFFFYAYRESIF